MTRKLLLLLMALAAGCSKGPEADLQYIKQARSLAAEWALINEQARQGKLTNVYVASMHRWLRDNLRTTNSSLSQPESRYGEEIRTLIQQPDDVAPELLRAHCEVLKRLEDELESA